MNQHDVNVRGQRIQCQCDRLSSRRTTGDHIYISSPATEQGRQKGPRLRYGVGGCGDDHVPNRRGGKEGPNGKNE